MTQSEHFRLLGGLLRRAESFSRLAVWAGGALTVASVLLISFDVLARKFLGFTTGGADELSSYAFAISTSWALAFATLLRVAAVLDWISMVALAVFMVYLTYYASEVVQTSWAQKSAANTPLATPLWIPQGLWLLGLGWMCITVALMLARASAALVTGDIELVRSICGVRSAQEEADEEAAAGERMVKGEAA
jgi:TRAP-type C4-dicarboxylate transport system permease small subunit